MNFRVDFRPLINGIRARGPTLLSIGAVIGVVVTAVSAAKAAPTAKDISKDLKFEPETKQEDRAKIIQIVKTYTPTFIFGSLTIAAIIASNQINIGRINALSGAYTQMRSRYLDYASAAACALGGAEANESIHDQVVKDIKQDVEQETPPGQFIFVDEYSKQDFVASREDVISALYMLNRTAQIKRCVPLNLYYSLLGLPKWDGDGSLPVNSGDILVWDMDDLASEGKEWIDILPVEHKEESGEVWYSLLMLDEPLLAEWFR